MGASHSFRRVAVTTHDVRSDVPQPGVVTALDALISLTEERGVPLEVAERDDAAPVQT